MLFGKAKKEIEELKRDAAEKAKLIRAEIDAFIEENLIETVFSENRIDASPFIGGAPMPMAEACAEPIEFSPAPRAKVSARKLEDVLKETEETFQQHLFRLISEKGVKNAEVYKKANLDKRLFAKIKADVNYSPKKNTALALCIALELNLDETIDLISRAGYTLSHSSKFDLVIEYFIEKEVYDVYLIDEALYDHNLPMLSNY